MFSKRLFFFKVVENRDCVGKSLMKLQKVSIYETQCQQALWWAGILCYYKFSLCHGSFFRMIKSIVNNTLQYHNYICNKNTYHNRSKITWRFNKPQRIYFMDLYLHVYNYVLTFIFYIEYITEIWDAFPIYASIDRGHIVLHVSICPSVCLSVCPSVCLLKT